jgi:hypothetical protein
MNALMQLILAALNLLLLIALLLGLIEIFVSIWRASYLPRTRRIRHGICLLLFCDLKGGELSARWGDIL